MIFIETKAEKEVLEQFFRDPELETHIRGLTEKLDSSYYAVRQALNNFTEKGLLKKDSRSKMTFYTAKNSENFREAKRLYNLSKLRESGLIEKIDQEKKPDAIVLFGSYLKGRDHKGSDIDLAVINGRDTAIDLTVYEKKLGSDIQLVDIEKPREENKEFINTLANGYTLKGYLELE